MGRRCRLVLSAFLVAILATVAAVPAAFAVSVVPPTIAVAFATPTANVGEAISLQVTVTNPNVSDNLSGIAVTTDFGGLVLAYPSGLTGSCGGGTITPATGSVALAGAALAGGASCSFSVDVLGQYASTYTALTNNITSTEGGAGGTASASLKVDYLPLIVASFTPNKILVGGTSTLTFSIMNPETSSTDLTGVGMTSTLPAGLTAPDSSAVEDCTGGTLAVSGNVVTLSRGTLFASWMCTFSIVVTATDGGTYHVPAGPVTSTNGTTSRAATADLSVVWPVQLEMAFSPASIFAGGNSTLTFTLTNSPLHSGGLTGIAMGVTLDAGLTTPNKTATACGGTLTVVGQNAILLTGGTLAEGANCVFSVVVTAAADGHYTAGSSLLTSVESESNGPAVLAELLVGVAPTPPPTVTVSGTPGRPDPFMPIAVLMALAAGAAAMFAVQLRVRRAAR